MTLALPNALLQRRRRWAAVAAVALIAVFPKAEPAQPIAVKGDDFISAATTGILNIEGGECFSDPAYSKRSNDVVVIYKECEERADNESYGFVHVADGEWNRPAVAAYGWAECGKDFQRRWGTPEESGLNFFPILPTAETWADGDRDIMCVVYNPDGKITRNMVPLVH
ncbi:hypothetical protein [Micromonospora sp. NBC_01796]|uniref:hypothetical protein n=1 Tax=Micromonospora sp. NBC_01796 TaxID=2975987 RepID=UPI002DD866A7|nr:hypothetical protein [Micromonospora sp. NBC_01796]WSA83771.1 hypothetical protein OIE47_25760 [Micromonospora sp. NBC_01796]